MSDGISDGYRMADEADARDRADRASPYTHERVKNTISNAIEAAREYSRARGDYLEALVQDRWWREGEGKPKPSEAALHRLRGERLAYAATMRRIAQILDDEHPGLL